MTECIVSIQMMKGDAFIIKFSGKLTDKNSDHLCEILATAFQSLNIYKTLLIDLENVSEISEKCLNLFRDAYSFATASSEEKILFSMKWCKTILYKKLKINGAENG